MKKTVLIAVPAAAVLLILSVLLWCFSWFGTWDVITVTKALHAVSSGEATHVEIASAPNRIVVATPDNSYQNMVQILQAEGYVVHEEERMGSMIAISKNGGQEQVLFSVNGNYSLWKWMK